MPTRTVQSDPDAHIARGPIPEFARGGRGPCGLWGESPREEGNAGPQQMPEGSTEGAPDPKRTLAWVEGVPPGQGTGVSGPQAGNGLATE